MGETIETKYKVGDEVWFRSVGNIFKSNVVKVIGGKEKLYRCTFYLTTSVFREEKLFPSEEKLLKSL